MTTTHTATAPTMTLDEVTAYHHGPDAVVSACLTCGSIVTAECDKDAVMYAHNYDTTCCDEATTVVLPFL